MLVGMLSLLFACDPKESDAARYTRLVSLAAPGVDDVRGCAQLDDPDLRGDCGLATARRAAAVAAAPHEEFCAQIDGESWQAECYFMSAEAYNAEGRFAQAAAMCVQATTFTDHCAQHLWQGALGGLTFRDGSAAFAPRLPDAQRLHRRWAPLLDEHTDFSARFWRRYFEGGFERSRAIDLQACAPLPEAEQARCRAAGASLLTRRLLEAIRVPQAHATLCAAAPTAADASRVGPPQLRASPDPDLDAVVAQFQQTYCDGGQPRPGSADTLPFDPAP